MNQKVGEHKVKMGIIFNIQKFCIHDGDGVRTCVFLKGCPLRCIWCHNPESLDVTPSLSFNKLKCSSCGRCLAVCPARTIENGILKVEREKCMRCGKCAEVCLGDANEIYGHEMTATEVMDEVMKDKMFYDTSGGGLTVTGGEPSYQADFTLELLRLSKNAGITFAIETCGTGTRDFYEKSADLGTTFLYDIKCIDPVRHREFTGADNTRIMSNLRYLMDRGADIIIRLPLVPDCNDSDEDIAMLAAFLNKNKGRYRYAEIMPYHTLGIGKSEKIGATVTYSHDNASDAEISRWCSLFTSRGIDIRVSK
ncbi:MAG: glycyl-radical enzyme activating protein [Clostridia bacterium]|nr:glycyl-radical enzyme activating protein [Clostridia bacterium]